MLYIKLLSPLFLFVTSVFLINTIMTFYTVHIMLQCDNCSAGKYFKYQVFKILFYILSLYLYFKYCYLKYLVIVLKKLFISILYFILIENTIILKCC